MLITHATIYKVSLPLKHPFAVSFGTIKTKDALILELTDQSGTKGYSECSAFEVPFYTEEFRAGALALLKDQLIPLILNRQLAHPDDVYPLYAHIRRNQMAIASVNCALWDVYAKQHNVPLATALGGTKHKVEVGVSIGIQPSPAKLVEVVGDYLAQGYRRIKVKIKPGADYTYLAAVRRQFPNVMLMADANSAYSLADTNHLKKFDALNLAMIEQPLAPGDMVDHATLQSQLTTPLCLDESILSLADAKQMVKLKSGKIINLKVARVGGLGNARQIQEFARKHGIKCWCGGMLDTGVGRANNIALASLAGLDLPADLSATDRYFDRDITTPPVKLTGTYVPVPTKPGIGFEIDHEFLRAVCTARTDIG